MIDPLQDKIPHIWIIDFAEEEKHLDSYFVLLSQDEIKKANTFIFNKDRIASIISRGVLRKLLSNYLNVDAKAIKFQYSRFGKPELKDINSNLHFNVSHSNKMGLIGFNLSVSIGVDIEFMNFKPDLDSVAKRFFSKSEILDYTNLSEEQRPRAFFNCWTRKESFLKATGDGLSFPLNQFDVSLVPGFKVELIRTSFNPDEKENWSLKSIEICRDYIAAFAVREQILSFKKNFYSEVKNRITK